MSCSKQFSTTDRLGLDLYKVLWSAKLQMSVFSINIMRSLIKILNMRGPRIEPWGIPVILFLLVAFDLKNNCGTISG